MTNTKLIDRIDNSILKFNKKMATKYVNKTHRSKANLEEKLYYGSALAFGTNAITTGYYIMALPAIWTAANGYKESLRPRGVYRSKITKYVNTIMYGLGALNTLAGAGGMIVGVVNQDTEILKKSFNLFTNGLGLFGWASADYVSRANIDYK